MSPARDDERKRHPTQTNKVPNIAHVLTFYLKPTSLTLNMLHKMFMYNPESNEPVVTRVAFYDHLALFLPIICNRCVKVLI